MKKLFHTTVGERIGALLLLCALVLLLTLRWVVRPSGYAVVPEKDSTEQELFTRFRDSLKSERREYAPKQRLVERYSLFGFDPNQADSATFRRLGLPPYVARNIERYRSKGGLFRTKEAFAKIYGITPEKFAELSAYIEIDTTRFARKEFARKDTIPSRKFQAITAVDLNRADTSLLRKIPGIGAGYALQIVRYRDQLGGFVAAAQVKEIAQLPDSVATMLLTGWGVVEEFEVRRLAVNRSGVERLRAHPYLNFYQARAIVELKKQRGRVSSIKELSLLEEFTTEDLGRLVDYLEFTD